MVKIFYIIVSERKEGKYYSMPIPSQELPIAVMFRQDISDVIMMSAN